MSADLARAMELVIAAGAADHEVSAFRVEGEPVAKARARVQRGRSGLYTPKRTSGAEETIAQFVMASGVPRFDGNVAVGMVFYRSNRHLIDTDNLMKTVLDGITKSRRVWQDDSQVTALVGVAEYDPEWPRTAIAIAHHTSALARGEDALTHVCITCGKRYRPHGSPKRSRYCSRACRSTRAARQICADCGGPTSAPHVARCHGCHLNHRRGAAA